MFTRNLEEPVRDALRRSPVVLINGARQVGKTTLARHLVDAGAIQRMVSLDDLTQLGAASSDPESFVGETTLSTVIDEVQLEPRLFRAIKASVDRDRTPGRFLLTGSADLSVLPAAADALVGRLEATTLWPLSQGEIRGTREGFADALFDEHASWGDASSFDRAALATAICTGGYPEPVLREPDDREPWHRSYVDLVLRREIAERTDIRGLATMPRLLSLLSARTMTLVSTAEVARVLEAPATTVRRYIDLLEAAMLVRMVPAYSKDVAKRVVKSPKVAVVDTGLAVALAGLDEDGLKSDPAQFGRLAETFVINEITRQLGWARTRARVMHTRTTSGREVDIVLEAQDGRVSGVEVKVGSSVGPRDFAGLKMLRDALGDRFVHGVLLYTGKQAVSYGPGLRAVPMSALWEQSRL